MHKPLLSYMVPLLITVGSIVFLASYPQYQIYAQYPFGPPPGRPNSPWGNTLLPGYREPSKSSGSFSPAREPAFVLKKQDTLGWWVTKKESYHEVNVPIEKRYYDRVTRRYKSVLEREFLYWEDKYYLYVIAQDGNIKLISFLEKHGSSIDKRDEIELWELPEQQVVISLPLDAAKGLLVAANQRIQEENKKKPFLWWFGGPDQDIIETLQGVTQRLLQGIKEAKVNNNCK